MEELYDALSSFQERTQKRLLSLNIQREKDGLSCIAVTNPIEVTILGKNGNAPEVSSDGPLYVKE